MLQRLLNKFFIRQVITIEMLRAKQSAEREEMNARHAMQKRAMSLHHQACEARLSKKSKDRAKLYELEGRHRQEMLRLEQGQGQQRVAMNERHINARLVFENKQLLSW